MNPTSKEAQFTVVLPVKNGGNYLHLCVASILAQSYQNFELVILENKSTDGTAGWLQSLEAKDHRVRVVAAEKSLSIEENWQRIASIPKKEFVTVIGHDDLLEPDFLQEINSLIQRESAANLYLTHFKLIDSNGQLIRYCRPIPERETAAEFLAARMSELRDSFGTGYVMRSSHYDRLGGIPPYRDLLYADDALWLNLMRSSFKITSPNVCFSYRLHTGSISGSPNPDALFEGLKRYLNFLEDFASCDENIARTMKMYAPLYVNRHCRNRYYLLLKVLPWKCQADQFKIVEIERLVHKYSPGVSLTLDYQNLGKRICIKVITWLQRRCG